MCFPHRYGVRSKRLWWHPHVSTARAAFSSLRGVGTVAIFPRVPRGGSGWIAERLARGGDIVDQPATPGEGWSRHAVVGLPCRNEHAPSLGVAPQFSQD